MFNGNNDFFCVWEMLVTICDSVPEYVNVIVENYLWKLRSRS